jgi:hypothetical protein
MGQVLHGRATTTGAIRRAIQHGLTALLVEQRAELSVGSTRARRSALTSASAIVSGKEMNIDELDSGGRVFAQWCFAPLGNLVVGDVLLTQKIALETMECDALRIANRRPH